MPVLTTIVLGFGLALVAVFIHHECLIGIKRQLSARQGQLKRWHIGATVLVLLVAHALEILVFAIGLYVLVHFLELGALLGESIGTFHTFVYFSFSSYTSLGIGDLQPMGALRLLTGFEALVGLLLIGWSASFLYLEMRTHWGLDNT